MSFTPDGKQLVVTIKDGPAAGAHCPVHPDRPGADPGLRRRERRAPFGGLHPDNLQNRGPFGFSFDRRRQHADVAHVRRRPEPHRGGRLVPDQPNGTLDPIIGDVPNTPARLVLVREQREVWLDRELHLGHDLQLSASASNGSLTLLQAVAGNHDDPGPTTPGLDARWTSA